MRENLIKEKHNGGLGGYFGADKTYEQLNRFYFWSKMRSEVEKYVKNCKVCQYAQRRSQNAGVYVQLPIPDRPWDMVSMDWFWVYQELKEETIQFMLWLTNFLKWHILFHVIKLMMLLTLLIYFLRRL